MIHTRSTKCQYRPMTSTPPVVRDRVLAPECLPRNEHHADHTHRHVEPVEAGHRVKRRPIEPRADQKPVMDQFAVLVDLDAHERRPDEHGRHEPPSKCLGVTVLGRGKRLDHRHAAANEQKGVCGCDRDVQHLPRLAPCLRIAEPQNDVGADEGGEEHHLGAEEHPHAQLLVIDPGARLDVGRGLHNRGGGRMCGHHSPTGPAAGGGLASSRRSWGK